MAQSPTLDPRVDAYIRAAAPFARPILERVRAAFHAGCPDLRETIKWGVPTFERNGMLGGMSAFKAHVGFGFWRAKELDDPAGLFGGERKASPMHVKVRAVAELPAKSVLVAYVKAAARLDAAPRPKRAASPKKPALRAPAWFLAAVRADPRALATWGAFSPSCKREYLAWVTEAKREETRAKRLTQTVAWLAEGKRRNWRYE